MRGGAVPTRAGMRSAATGQHRWCGRRDRKAGARRGSTGGGDRREWGCGRQRRRRRAGRRRGSGRQDRTALAGVTGVGVAVTGRPGWGGAGRRVAVGGGRRRRWQAEKMAARA
jgi:hypothetical protein